MGNTYTNSLANPEHGEAGSRRTTQLFDGIQKSVNHAHARGGNSIVISQSYPNGSVSHVSGHGAALTVVGTPIPVMRWRVPVIDNGRTLKFHIVAERTENPFDSTKTVEIVIKTTTTNLTKTIAVGNIGVAQYTTEVPIHISDAYETIEVRFNCDIGASFKIHTVTAFWKSYASPLSAGYSRQPTDASGVSTHRFAALGTSQLSSDKPISAVIGKNIIDNLQAIDNRAETGHCWSAFYLPGNLNTNTQLGLTAYDEGLPALIRQRRGNHKVRFELSVSNPTSTDLALVVCVTDAASLLQPWPAGHNARDFSEYCHTFVVSAGASHTWVSHTTPLLRFSSRIGQNNPDYAIQAGVVRSSMAEGRKSTADLVAHSVSGRTVEVHSVNIWSVP